MFQKQNFHHINVLSIFDGNKSSKLTKTFILLFSTDCLVTMPLIASIFILIEYVTKSEISSHQCFAQI